MTKNILFKEARISEILAVYRQEMDRIRAAYLMLEESWGNLQIVAGKDTYRDRLSPVNEAENVGDKTLAAVEFEAAELRIRKTIWRIIFDKINPWPFLSKERSEALKDWLDSDKIAPLEEEIILAQIESLSQNRKHIMYERALEIYEFITPPAGWSDHVTNAVNRRSYTIGKKVIIPNVVRHSYQSSGVMEIAYHRQEKLGRMDSLFFILDGKHFPDDYWHGPLIMGIKTHKSGEVFETDYFRCRGYTGAGTLHVWFQRPDLVAKLESIVSEGNRLAQNRQGMYK
jgi:hypothetical protein